MAVGWGLPGYRRITGGDRRLADAVGGALRWEPGVTVSRRASVGAGELLLAICAVGIGASRGASTQVTLAEHMAGIADLYQNARYYAVLEDAELNTDQLQRAPAVRREHENTATSLTRTLSEI